VAQARVLTEGFRGEYNEERAQQSLGYLTPVTFKQKWLLEQEKTTGD
jgi:transposase InsO family protein